MIVAVTGVGGGVGQSIIKALQNTEYPVIGIDGELYGTGLYATRKAFLVHYANSPLYIDNLIDICQKSDCAILFPGLDAELIPLAKSIDRLRSNGIIPVVSDPRVIEIADDKLETTVFLRSHGFPYPETFSLPEYEFQMEFPVFLKPRKGGARSAGTCLAKNKKEYIEFTNTIDAENYVVQEYLSGEEYTCGSVSFEKGCIGTILMQRQLRDGDTYKAFVRKDEHLSSFLTEVIDALKPFGACNIQLKERDGVYYIFEINARSSGTTASRALAGFNEPKMICDYIFKGIDNPTIQIKEVAIFRYWKELLVEYEQINAMRSNGSIANKETFL